MIITTEVTSEKLKKHDVKWEAHADIMVGFKAGYERYDLAAGVLFGLEDELRAIVAGFRSGIFYLVGDGGNVKFSKAGAYETTITPLPEAGRRVAAITIKQLGVATNDILGRRDGSVRFAAVLPATTEQEMHRQIVSWLSLRVSMPIPRDADYPGFSERLTNHFMGRALRTRRSTGGDAYLYFDKARYSVAAFSASSDFVESGIKDLLHKKG